MKQGLFCRDALLRRVNEKLSDKIDGLRRGVRHDLFKRNRWVLRESDFVVIRQLGHSRPRLLRRRAENAQDAAQLLDVVFAGEKRRVVEKLAKDATYGPQVNSLVVFSSAVKKLGGSE